MALATDLMTAGLPQQPANSLGLNDLTPYPGSAGAPFSNNVYTLTEVGAAAYAMRADTPLGLPVYFTNPNAETALIRPTDGGTINGNAVQLNLAQNQMRMVIRLDQTRFISFITS